MLSPLLFYIRQWGCVFRDGPGSKTFSCIYIVKKIITRFALKGQDSRRSDK